MILRALKQHVSAMVAVALLLSVVAVAAGLGYAGRHSLSEQQTFETDGPQETYAKLTASGVKGRTLVVFGEHSGISDRDYRYRRMEAKASAGTTAPIDAANVVSQIVYSRAARNVIVVVPQSVWTALSEDWATHWDSFPSAMGFTRRVDGVPVTFTTADKLELLRGEKVVVIISMADRGSYPAETLQRWTAPDVADLVVIEGGQSR